MPVTLSRPRQLVSQDERISRGIFEVGGKDLVAYWPLTPGEDRFRDISGKGWHLSTLTGTPSETRPGPFGGPSIGFDGSTNLAQASTSMTNPTTAMSVVAMAAHANAAGTIHVMGRNATNNIQWTARTGTGAWQVYIMNTANGIHAGPAVAAASTADGRWRPVIWSWDGTTLTLDVDGVVVTWASATTGTWTTSSAAAPTIGGSSSSAKGAIDQRHTATINRALTAAERGYIRALMLGR